MRYIVVLDMHDRRRCYLGHDGWATGTETTAMTFPTEDEADRAGWHWRGENPGMAVNHHARPSDVEINLRREAFEIWGF